MNEKEGAEAKDWKAGKPVRVVRSSKGRKHSKYCPEDGNRYDGIYKVSHLRVMERFALFINRLEFIYFIHLFTGLHSFIFIYSIIYSVIQ